MPKKPKKKIRRPSFFKRYAKGLMGTALLVLIVLVTYAVLHNNKVTDASLTAATGTSARSDQINNSEINQESSIDNSYDSQHSMNAQSDANTITDIEQAVPDEN
jgi:hypothetical protein